jgi:hypothetical protein
MSRDRGQEWIEQLFPPLSHIMAVFSDASHVFFPVRVWPPKICWIYARWTMTPGWQIYCVFLFLSAASLFGTIIAQVNEGER